MTRPPTLDRSSVASTTCVGRRDRGTQSDPEQPWWRRIASQGQGYTGWARSSTTSAPGPVSSIAAGPTTLAARLPPPTTMRRGPSRGVDPQRQPGRQGERGDAADRHAVNSAVPRRERTRPSSSRGACAPPVDVEPGRRQHEAGQRRTARLARRLADHDDGVGRVVHGVAVGGAELGRVGERRVAVDDVDAGRCPATVSRTWRFDLVHGWGRLRRWPPTEPAATSPQRRWSCCRR